MQTTSLQSLSTPASLFGLFQALPYDRKKRACNSSIFAMRRDDRVNGKLVDENMIVLRIRIQEMKMEEKKKMMNCAIESTGQYEKEWYNNYDSDVYEAVGLLQNLMMDARPSLVLGVVVLLIFSASTSLAVILGYLLDFVMR
ncbi:hypothetical protein ACJIZ3_020283 [Penstemon smallii]|uniref:Uncharacterized protein n=1 Tax=Penstemon smallii TaxID=265156 RepID=A0ABD3SI56_9LAMI